MAPEAPALDSGAPSASESSMPRAPLLLVVVASVSILSASCSSDPSSAAGDDASPCASDPSCVDGGDLEGGGDATVDGSPDVLGDGAGDGGGPDATPIPCGTSAWATYGHDGRRTFATDACIKGPLSVSWSYTPAPPTGRTTKAMHHALAQKDAVFLQWGASIEPYVGTTALDRVSTTGTRVWTMDTGSDANEGNWGSLIGGNVWLDDDGVYLVDAASGVRGATTGVDWWGQSIPNGAGAFLVVTSKSDGPGLFVASLDDKLKTLWKQNEQGTHCGDGFADTMGGIALDGGVLFYAPNYNTGSTKTLDFASGLYAFDASSGAPKWKIPTTPSSVISAGDGLVYLIESSTTLIARKQSDGSKVWSVDVTNVGAQAPVLAGGLAIVGTATDVLAFDAKTGAPAWTSKVSGAAARAYTIDISNGCSGLQHQGAAIATSIAAALGSGTLIVTGSDGVHVLDLATGVEQWKGAVTGAKGSLHDPIAVGDVVYVVDSSPTPIGGFSSGALFSLKKP